MLCCDVCDKQVQNMSIKQPSSLLVELWGLQSVLKVKPKSEVPCLVDVRQRRREEAPHCPALGHNTHSERPGLVSGYSQRIICYFTSKIECQLNPTIAISTQTSKLP